MSIDRSDNKASINSDDAIADIDANAPLQTMPESRSVPLLVWAMMAVLILIALLVIFVLPKLVENYELPFTPRSNTVADVTISAPSTASNQTLSVSPFNEAQKAKQRAEAQDVLAALLKQQDELEAIGVKQWAEQEFAQALALAQLADEAYRSQDFLAATSQYQASSDALESLLASVPQVLEATLESAMQALQFEDAAAAEASFAMAVLISPENVQARVGLARAQSLEQVLALISQAQQEKDNNNLEAARGLLQQALALDQRHDDAQAQLEDIQQMINDRAFTARMSAGFLALSQGRAEEAIVEFEYALAMRPESPQALAAIEQTQDQIAVAVIGRHRQEAKRLEGLEQWQEVINQYDGALAIDPNLVFAAQGKDYAQKRFQLATLLQGFVSNPLRLGDSEIYDQALQVFYTGQQIKNRGPVLESQLAAIEEVLKKAQVPLNVQIISDNLTEVTLYQVGVLGQLKQHTVALTPGQYVVVGTRAGYRDVREEFVVGFEQNPSPITVICNDKLETASRQ